VTTAIVRNPNAQMPVPDELATALSGTFNIG
jgi:hypothetical protein